MKVRNAITFDITGLEGQTGVINSIQKVTRKIAINEPDSLNFTTINLPENMGYGLIENEAIIHFEGHEYSIKQVSKRPHHTIVRTINRYIDDMGGTQKTDYLIGTYTYKKILDYIFRGTNWTYELADESIGERRKRFSSEVFGKGSSQKLLKEFCDNIAHLEFKLLPGRVVYIADQLSQDFGANYEYGKNIKSIGEEFDSLNLYTAIKGTYSKIVGYDGSGEPIEEERTVTYYSPLIDLYGYREAEPITSSDVRADEEMLELLEQKLEDEVKYSINVEIVELHPDEGETYRPKEIGETITIRDPRLNLDTKTRVLAIEESLRLFGDEYKIVPTAFTFGNYKFGTFTDKISKEIDELREEIEKLKEKKSILWLSRFQLGHINCLAIPGILVSKETEPKDFIAKAESEVENLIGLDLELKSSYEGFYLEVTYVYADGTTSTMPYSESLKEENFPKDGMSALIVRVAEKPPEEVEEDEEILEQYYGLSFAADTQNYWLSEFRIGDIDCLALPGLQMFNLDDEPTAVIEYEEFYQHEGFVLRLKEEYANYTLKFIEVYDDGYIDEYIYEDFTHGYMNLPSRDQVAHIVVVSNPDNTEHQYFGVKFVKKEPEQTITTYRNVETIPDFTYYSQDENAYFCDVVFYHRELGKGNKISVKEGEVLTGVTYLILESFSGGVVTFYANFGSYRSPCFSQYIASGEDYVIPLPYTIKVERKQEMQLLSQSVNSNEDKIISEKLYFNVEIEGWALKVKFDYGSLSGAIENIYYEGYE